MTAQDIKHALQVARSAYDHEAAIVRTELRKPSPERAASQAQLERVGDIVNMLQCMLYEATKPDQPVARTPLSDEQIESAFKAAGGRWADNSHWVIEDADLHPFVRGITQEKQG